MAVYSAGLPRALCLCTHPKAARQLTISASSARDRDGRSGSGFAERCGVGFVLGEHRRAIEETLAKA